MNFLVDIFQVVIIQYYWFHLRIKEMNRQNFLGGRATK